MEKTARRSLAALLAPLDQVPHLTRTPLGPFAVGPDSYALERVTFSGGRSSDPIRIGIFAAIHGDEPAGAAAVVDFLGALGQNPELAEFYEIDAYPVCNPTGYEDNRRESRGGVDLNREFWRESLQPEVRLLEGELASRHFHGIIQLHADDTSEGIYGFVRGATLTENLLRPALRRAGEILPRNQNATIDGFAARDGIIRDLYEGVLKAHPEMRPEPFEIIFETPGTAPVPQQVRALVVAMETILLEYRGMISFAQNL